MKSLLGAMSPLVTMKSLMRLSHRNVLLPFYHSVSVEPLPHIRHLYQNRTIYEFEDDLDFMCEHYRAISIDELYQIVEDDIEPSEPVFHLTFDDGLAECYSVVAPILKKRGLTATIFLNSLFVDNQDLFYRYKASLLIDQLSVSVDLILYSEVLDQNLRSATQIKEAILNIKYADRNKLDLLAQKISYDFNDYLRRHRPYLSSTQIQELIQQGFTFGSHSVDHPILCDLSFEEQQLQISQSFAALIDKFQIKNKYFSFPFNDEGVTSEFMEWMYKAQDIKLSFGISGLKDDTSKYHLHRLPMEGSHDKAEYLVKSEYLYYLAKSVVNKNRISRA